MANREVTGSHRSPSLSAGAHAGVASASTDDQVRREREAVVELFRILESSEDLHGLMRGVTHFLSGWADMEAVGIRLLDGDDYPYFETVGFPEKFVAAERSLCARSGGEVIRDELGRPLLECMCGNIVCGRFDAKRSFFTAQGAFWTNSTTQLLANTTEAEREGRTRNRCNAEGYESLALFPIRSRGETFGLLQLNDRRPGRFTPELVAMFERLADSLALALAHRRTEQQLLDSQRRQGELHDQLVRRAAEAERANQAKDVFLAMLLHELRTPLNVILLHVQLLRTGRGDEARVARVSDVIARAVQTQTQLIEDLLDVSRIVSGKLRLEMQPVDLAGRVRAAVETLQPQAEARGVRVTVDVADGVDLVRGDPTRVQQIVWNLLGNAIKFTEEGGRVDVTVDRDGDRPRVRVADTGRGIPADFLPRVFDRFAQADSTNTRSYGGLGLGLAIVRHLVEAHEATITAESPGLGLGATFTVTFPGTAQAASAIARPDAATRATLLRGVRVLVVDDDREAREALSELLLDAGAITHLSASAASAADAVEQFRPDVMLCDIAMPGENGYSLLRRVKSSDTPASAHLRAAAVTALASEADRRDASAAGFAAHIAKPVQVSRLVSVVAELARP